MDATNILQAITSGAFCLSKRYCSTPVIIMIYRQKGWGNNRLKDDAKGFMLRRPGSSQACLDSFSPSRSAGSGFCPMLSFPFCPLSPSGGGEKAPIAENSTRHHAEPAPAAAARLFATNLGIFQALLLISRFDRPPRSDPLGGSCIGRWQRQEAVGNTTYDPGPLERDGCRFGLASPRTGELSGGWGLYYRSATLPSGNTAHATTHRVEPRCRP